MSRLPPALLVVVLSACGAPTPVVNPGVDPGAPRCSFYDGKVNCPPVITAVAGREVYWQSPSSPAPDAGFPAVVVYQGSFFGPATVWNEVSSSMLFGGYHQARLHALLLEQGFTVITPSALAGIAWQTNSGIPWDATSDKPFIDALLAGMGGGTFGPVDMTRVFAGGISSGGYMTSRMAVSYPGVFRALFIHSASFATCVSVACVLPAAMPAQHPPTRFLHGRGDLTVPLHTAEVYQRRLTAEGLEADIIIDDSAGHEWLRVAPERVLEWLQAH